MRRKKVLVHGTPDSLQKFFSDDAAREHDIVAILSDDKISATRDGQRLDAFRPQSLPPFVYDLVDGIVLTSADEDTVQYFFGCGIEPRKIFPWDAEQGWTFLVGETADGTKINYLCGLEFHIRNEDDRKFFRETLGRFQLQRYVKNLDPQLYPAYLAQVFQNRTGRPLDFNNPRTFTEKMQWMKIFDSTPIKSRLSDKILVRPWVTEKIGEQYLIPLLNVWDDFDDIDFDELPDQFVLKCTHGSGMNIIVRDKKTFDVTGARERINAWLAFNYGAHFLELNYANIKRRILAEKFMSNGDAPDFTVYKFWGFDGKPVVLHCDTERSTGLRYDYFSMNFEHLDIEQHNIPKNENPERVRRPKNFELMKELAAKLLEGFAYARADFFEVNGRVYFSEITFYHDGGAFSYRTAGIDEYLGSLLKLPKATPSPKLL